MIKKIPNILTIMRMFMIPIIIGAFYLDGKLSSIMAAAIFTFASITDYLDGALARALKAQTKFGRVLDPIADKLLVVATLVMLIHFDKAPVIPTLLILLREILVSGLRENLSSAKVVIPVSNLAKLKTAVQMIAIVTLIIGHILYYPELILSLGRILLWIAAILTIITGYSYCKVGMKHL